VSARVLIAEDEPHIVESLAFLLRREGYAVIAVGDGEAALARLRAREQPDLVILDVMLPLRNGLEVLQAIRGDERLRALRVMMLTAKAQAHDRAAAEQIGVDAYVTKPFSNRELLEQVRLLTAA
jgi:DNA-binding response OmpR family regulator